MTGVFIALYSLSLSLSQPSFTFSSTCCCWVVAKSCQSLCEPMNYGPPGSSIHGISQRPTPTKKKPGLGKEHIGRDLWGHRDGKAHQEGMRVRKLWVYPRSGQKPQLPGLAVNTSQHPSPCHLSALPHICQERWGLDCGTCWALDTAVCLRVCGRGGVLLTARYNSGKQDQKAGINLAPRSLGIYIGLRARGQTRAAEKGAQRISWKACEIGY